MISSIFGSAWLDDESLAPMLCVASAAAAAFWMSFSRDRQVQHQYAAAPLPYHREGLLQPHDYSQHRYYSPVRPIAGRPLADSSNIAPKFATATPLMPPPRRVTTMPGRRFAPRMQASARAASPPPPSTKREWKVDASVNAAAAAHNSETLSSDLMDGFTALSKERDSCGVGFVVSENSHKTLSDGLVALGCMEHRGACGGDGISGDGAGVMTAIPWDIPDFAKYTSEDCPSPGVAMLFLPRDEDKRNQCKELLEDVCLQNELKILGWREVPTDPSILGEAARETMPSVWQLFIGAPARLNDNDDNERDGFERTLYLVRRRFEAERQLAGMTWTEPGTDVYFASFSSRTLVYKGMVQSQALARFYLDLQDKNYKTPFCVYHRRFSTNTSPKWPLAQPMRVLAHNGEINTLLGNLNWQKARETARSRQRVGDIHQKLKFGRGADLVNPAATDDIVMWQAKKVPGLEPIVSTARSDSANLDSVFEQMCKARHRAACAIMALVPAAYDKDPSYEKNPEIIDFYEYHASMLEPWDGPALLVFCDGKTIGASLDRNGLRPARFCKRKDGSVYMMSETGVIPGLEDNEIVSKGRLGPGQMITVDLESGEFKTNIEVKSEIAKRHEYGEWLARNRKVISPMEFETEREFNDDDALFAQASFGWGAEDVTMPVADMASKAIESTYSMGDDAPLAVLSTRNHVLPNYFKQRFAQVTNPPIDPLREGVVMSLKMTLGKKGVNVYKASEENARVITLESPVLNDKEMKSIQENGTFQSVTLSTRYPVDNNDIEKALKDLCDSAVKAVEEGAEILVLSDRTDGAGLRSTTYIPPLLAMGAVHHRLIDEGLRMDTGIIVETGSCWSTHHFACLYGYGAHAVHPYMAFETVRQWWSSDATQKAIKQGKMADISMEQAQVNYRAAVEKGLKKILSKIGISLLSSYHGAQIFEAIGLGDDVIETAFKGTPSRVGGMSLAEIGAETLAMRPDIDYTKLANPGFYKPLPKDSGEYHANSVQLAQLLHKSIGLDRNAYGPRRDGKPNRGVGEASVANYDIYKKSLETAPLASLRDLLDLKSDRQPIPIEEVESIEEIMKRFCTGAMSLGALSREAHETLAIAVNRVGGKSNSGEGGEDLVRVRDITDVDENGKSATFPHLEGLKNGDSANSYIHQVASGRFGVTPEFLTTAKQLEIKVAQGAKPGEGGQLPAAKINDYIAGLRATKPGVPLISPPPHHDIYSIEDLAQLIHDLHAINDKAAVSVKLVSCIGIGTVACGVAKANADVIQISSGDGGTGASPLSSIKHAGGPWELGVAESHASLLVNGLRSKVLLRVDGGIRTGRDVVVAALLGAEEFGFGTIAMIAEGCVMARVCHMNSCPVGVTSQKEELRAKFPGTPEHVVNFFMFVAEEVRELLAHLGYKSLKDVIGRADILQRDDDQHERVFKTSGLDMARMLNSLPCQSATDPCEIDPTWIAERQNRDVANLPVHINESSSDLDRSLAAHPDVVKVVEANAGVAKVTVDICNTDRSVGGHLSSFVARTHGNTGFKGEIDVTLKGSAGQSFGCFNVQNLTMRCIGEANDFVSKGQNSGKVIVTPPADAAFSPTESSVVGNACAYGATGGRLHVQGRAGERFCVRNSGITAVVEGTGDHTCEYMTGGTVVVLGSSGRNVGAGMTGGLGYFLDPTDNFLELVNTETVTVQRLKTPQAEAQIQGLLRDHVEETGSKRAQEILDDWATYKSQFWQIYPAYEADTDLVRDNSVIDTTVASAVAK